MGKYLDEQGTSILAEKIKSKIEISSEIPESPYDNQTILYVGESTEDFTNGCLYRYDETEEVWNSVQIIDGVARSVAGVASARIPAAPSANGTYILQCVVNNGTETYSWVASN